MKLNFALMAVIVLLTACSSHDRLDKTSNYWQRAETQSALYMTGPKAQHLLHQDIANCVAQLKELQRLDSIRNTIPTNTDNQVPDYNPSNTRIASADTPNRDGPLYAEYYDFKDFEGCMRTKGWQRALVMTPYQQIEGKNNWIRSLLDKDWGGATNVGNGEKSESIPDASPIRDTTFNQ